MALNEFEIIERLFNHLTGPDESVLCGIGDDGAVLGVPAGVDLVVSTDTLVSGVHFFPESEPADIGYKTLAVNLSDMAAMAAQPRWATLSLTLPETNMDWLGAFSRGFAGIARDHRVSLIGGDITHGPLSVNCTILGTVPNNAAVRRSGARPGDGVYVSGVLGLAALALRQLGPGGRNTVDVPGDCLERLLRPEPRVSLGLALAGTASAMIDLSDGLAGDLGHILEAAGHGAEVKWHRLPVSKDTGGFSDDELRRLAAAGGDDYELCFTVPPDRDWQLRDIAMAVDCPLTCIGRIVDGAGIRWLDAEGREIGIRPESYQHF